MSFTILVWTCVISLVLYCLAHFLADRVGQVRRLLLIDHVNLGAARNRKAVTAAFWWVMFLLIVCFGLSNAPPAGDPVTPRLALITIGLVIIAGICLTLGCAYSRQSLALRAKLRQARGLDN